MLLSLATSRGRRSEGTQIVNGAFNAPLKTGQVSSSRDATILALCRGQRVLHVGCTDAPFTAEKLESGVLLHSKLVDVAAAIVGADIDASGLDLLNSRIPGTYINLDVSAKFSDPALDKLRPTILLAGDVIEHVENQSAFVRGLERIARQFTGAKVVVTTPNALAIRQTVHTVANREVIHPDHRLIHSPRTIEYLFSTCGLELTELRYYNLRTGHSRSRRAYDGIPRVATKLRPAFADGMIAVAVPR